MFSLILAAASLTPAFNDIAYADLAYTKPSMEAACEARFDNGAIEITQAFNRTEQTSINVAVLTGRSQRSLLAGTRLWAESPYGPTWRALVLESTGQQIRIAVHHRFVGDLLTNGSPNVVLHERLDRSGVSDAIFVTVASDVNDFRGKLAEALDCADGIGI